MSPAVTRPEFERVAARVERIDTATGLALREMTGELAALTATLASVAKTTGEIRDGQADHDAHHATAAETTAARRRSDRRWLVGATTAAACGIGSLYPYLAWLMTPAPRR
jgi:hypothetical protein